MSRADTVVINDEEGIKRYPMFSQETIEALTKATNNFNGWSEEDKKIVTDSRFFKLLPRDRIGFIIKLRNSGVDKSVVNEITRAMHTDAIFDKHYQIRQEMQNPDMPEEIHGKFVEGLVDVVERLGDPASGVRDVGIHPSREITGATAREYKPDWDGSRETHPFDGFLDEGGAMDLKKLHDKNLPREKLRRIFGIYHEIVLRTGDRPEIIAGAWMDSDFSLIQAVHGPYLKEQFRGQDEAIREREEEERRRREEVESLQKQLGGSLERLRGLEDELGELRQGSKEYADGHILSNEEVNGLRAIIAGHEVRINELEAESYGVRDENGRLRKQSVGLRVENDGLEQKHKDYVDGHTISDEEVRRREEEIRRNLASVNDARSEAERRLSEKIADYKGLEIGLNVKDDELRIVRGTLDKLKNILEQEKTSNKEMVGYLSIELLKTRKALLKITEDNQTLVDALGEFERSLSLTVEGVVSKRLEDLDLNNLHEKVNGLLVSVDNYIDRVDEERRDLNTALAELQREKNRLVGELGASDNTKAELQRQLDEGKGRVIELEKKVLKAEAEKGLSEEEANRLIGSAVDRTAERFGNDYGSLLTKLGELREAFLRFETGTDKDLKGIDGKVGNVFKNLLSLTTEDGLLTQINKGLKELKNAYEEGKIDEGKVREILTPQLGQLDSLYTRLSGVAAQLEKSSDSRDEEALKQLGLVNGVLKEVTGLRDNFTKILEEQALREKELKEDVGRIKKSAEGIEGFAEKLDGTYRTLKRFAARQVRSLRSLSRNMWSNRVYSLITLGVVSFGLAAGYFVAMKYTRASDTIVASAGRMGKEHHDLIEEDKRANNKMLDETTTALDNATKNYGDKLNRVADDAVSKLNEGVNGLGSKLDEAGNKALGYVGEVDNRLGKTLGNTESRLELAVDNLEDKGNEVVDRLSAVGGYLENTEAGIGEKAVKLGETVDLLGTRAEENKRYFEGLDTKAQDSGKVIEILDGVDKSLKEQQDKLKGIEDKVDKLPTKEQIIEGVGQRVDEKNNVLITGIEAVGSSVEGTKKEIIGEVKAAEERLTGKLTENSNLVITGITDARTGLEAGITRGIDNLEKAINRYAGISQEEREGVLKGLSSIEADYQRMLSLYGELKTLSDGITIKLGSVATSDKADKNLELASDIITKADELYRTLNGMKADVDGVKTAVLEDNEGWNTALTQQVLGLEQRFTGLEREVSGIGDVLFGVSGKEVDYIVSGFSPRFTYNLDGMKFQEGMEKATRALIESVVEMHGGADSFIGSRISRRYQDESNFKSFVEKLSSGMKNQEDFGNEAVKLPIIGSDFGSR